MELWLQGGKSVQQIAAELGISYQSLKQWKKKLAALLVGFRHNFVSFAGWSTIAQPPLMTGWK